MSEAHFLIEGVAASYQPVSGDAVDCTVILYSDDAEFGEFESRPLLDKIALEVQSGALTPTKGGVFTIDPDGAATQYKVESKPRHTGIERDVWRMVVDEL
ncbi:head-tail joining protein [Cohaesibacter celericrescens]|uniref:Uncharacterized protein n=1 Tax=Cohaesibacter celericrescens TaxID=2067669 RepID=A0A2N5XX42_9HYPH|nr:hypothetical protein [Cohaesibacter celericrescens]PLW79074.1 hypothetical protein C0081_02250 [Cohaesibacter celericrescens]